MKKIIALLILWTFLIQYLVLSSFGRTRVINPRLSYLDEIRITNVARSEEYIEAVWNNTTMPEDYPDIWPADFFIINRPENGTTPTNYMAKNKTILEDEAGCFVGFCEIGKWCYVVSPISCIKVV